MDHHELLTAEEEACLVERAHAGDRAALERLVVHNQRLVRKLAERYVATGYGGDQDVDDLVQFGNIGLLRAIEKFETGRELRLSTYAYVWIDAQIRRNAAARSTGYGMTHREGLALNAIRRARARLVQVLARDPTAAEIAAAAGLDPVWVEAWLPSLDGRASLDTSLGGEEADGDMYEIVPDAGDNPADLAEQRVALDEIVTCVQALPEREREIITRRFLTNPPASRAAIGRALALSSTRVHQIERAAIRRLQFLMGERSERDGDV